MKMTNWFNWKEKHQWKAYDCDKLHINFAIHVKSNLSLYNEWDRIDPFCEEHFNFFLSDNFNIHFLLIFLHRLQFISRTSNGIIDLTKSPSIKSKWFNSTYWLVGWLCAAIQIASINWIQAIIAINFQFMGTCELCGAAHRFIAFHFILMNNKCTITVHISDATQYLLADTLWWPFT